MFTIKPIFISTILYIAAIFPILAAEPNLQLRTFIEDIVLIQDAGKITPLAKRWTVLPSLIVESTSPSLKAFTEEAFSEISSEIKLSQSSSLPLTVYIGTNAQLTKIASDKVPTMKLVDSGCWLWWDTDCAMQQGVAFICTDKIPTEKLKPTILKCLLHCFGFKHQSNLAFPSNFSSTQQKLISLTPLDKKILTFVYTTIPPGCDRKAFNDFLKESWK